jgi:hypothetical protein
MRRAQKRRAEDSRAERRGNPQALPIKRLSIKAGKSQTLTIPLKNFPNLAAGNYFVVARVVSGAVTLTAASSSTLTIAPGAGN